MKFILTRFLPAIILLAGLSCTCSYGQSTEINNRQFVAKKVNELKSVHEFTTYTGVFQVTGTNSSSAISLVVKKYSLLQTGSSLQSILSVKPDHIRLMVPVPDGSGDVALLLYKQSISPNGLTILTGSGTDPGVMPEIVHYRGIIEGQNNSIAAFSFSADDCMGMFSNPEGNFVLGRMDNDPGEAYIVYNDQDLIPVNNFTCDANTTLAKIPKSQNQGGQQLQSINCVNWYWETDYDIFLGKGSVAAVNTYMNNVFNQVSTLYANDGMNIGLQTLFIWDVTDPYTGPSTGNYLTQFGNYRTSFNGDLANLMGYAGGGGVAWLYGFCDTPPYRMGYCGINSTFSNVPTYSWTIEVVAHEEGHLFGSPHTHDCSWNGNNTKIDACGDVAGYPSGGCPNTNPALPPAGGTIMSYCHLTGAGINFSLGFGPQPAALMLNNENTAPCLGNCIGCPVPAQPASISGVTGPCQGSSQTYSVASVPGATGYTWTLPQGWSGSSTTNSISVVVGATSGNVSVTANNVCGSSTPKSLTIGVSLIPAQPGAISGNSVPCPNTAYTYTVTAVQGASSYTWTLPGGWSGTSVTNSINVFTGNSGGILSVYASNSCGNGLVRNRTLNTGSLPSTPGTITASAGGGKACPGDVKNYSVTQVNNANAYTWTAPLGAVVSSGQGTTNATITYGVGFTKSDSVLVTADNACGSSPPRSKQVAFNLPTQPSSISGSANGICGQTGVPYSVTAVSGFTYDWSFGSTNASVTGGQGSASVTAGFLPAFVSSTLNVYASNACGNGPSRTLTVNAKPKTPGAITGATQVCQNQQGVPYSIAAVSGATGYTWSGPSGSRFSDGINTSTTATFVTTSPSVTVNFKTTAGAIKVKATNTCGNSSNKSLTVAFNCRESNLVGSGNLQLSVAPNPARDLVTLSFVLVQEESYTISLMDLAGRLVQQKRGVGLSGSNELKLDVSTLSKGSYLLQVQTVSGNSVLRLAVD